MKDGFERLKTSSYIRLHRDLIDCALDSLNDAELKLWLALRGAAYDFEGSNIGQVRITVVSINSRFKWAQGKSSQTLAGLIRKNFAKRIRRGLYYIPHTLADVQNDEHLPVHVSERKVHSNEVNVQSGEQNRFKSLSYKGKESSSSLASFKDDSDGEFERLVEEVLGGGSK